MELKILVLVVSALCCLAQPSTGLRVLGLFPLPAHSHYIMFKALAEGLAERGHEVVSFNPFPNKSPKPNLTEVDTSLGRPGRTSTFTFDMVSTPSWGLPGAMGRNMFAVMGGIAGADLCREVFSMPEFRKLMAGGYGRFDLVLTEVFGSDCWAAVPHKLGVPVVSVSSAPDVVWMHKRIGSIDNPSYIHNVFLDLSGRMSLWERVTNTFNTLYINHLFEHHMQDGSDALVREFFGPEVPPLRELVKNTSLILLNRHVSIHAARPVVPNLVHVGGLHITAPPGKLDPELRRWMDGAEHGVIFFSLGSLIKAASMPAGLRDAMLGAFAALPQRVVWKYEDDSLKVPPNVRTSKWLPQLDILTHNKTVLFITHGGLMGTLESLHSSVPMLGMPLFADQMSNINLYMSLGIAEKLDVATTTKDTALAKLRLMTRDRRYLERAREVSARFRDRPRQAMDEAVWWLEYVVRHGGAKHLRTVGADLPWYEYLLLDVVAVFVAAALAAVLLLVWVARWLMQLAGTSTTSKKVKTK